MRLGLSAAAAPDASAEELAEICARRGFELLEVSDDLPTTMPCARFDGDTVEFEGRVLPVVRGTIGADVAYALELDGSTPLPELELTNVRYIRLLGGGPETTLQDGNGIGALMTRLALAGYHGPLVIAPSSPRYRVAWQQWLGRRAGTGCGSKTMAVLS